MELGRANREVFPNGEIYVRYPDSVRGADAFVIQSHCPPLNHNIMEQLVMLDALERASAKRITAVIPFLAYARQDRKAAGREPITARLVADMFKAAGAKRMISIDLHSGQIQGFFEGPVDHLTAMPVLEQYVRTHAHEPVIVSPDAGRIKVYSLDSIAGRAWISKQHSAEFCSYLQNMFDALVYEEIVPAIRQDCQSPDIEIVTAGASIGAFNAVATICRHPDAFRLAIAMSGTYDLSKYLNGRMPDDFYFSSPLHYLPGLEGPQLDALQQRFILLPSGAYADFAGVVDLGPQGHHRHHPLAEQSLPIQIGQHLPDGPLVHDEVAGVEDSGQPGGGEQLAGFRKQGRAGWHLETRKAVFRQPAVGVPRGDLEGGDQNEDRAGCA